MLGRAQPKKPFDRQLVAAVEFNSELLAPDCKLKGSGVASQ